MPAFGKFVEIRSELAWVVFPNRLATKRDGRAHPRHVGTFLAIDLGHFSVPSSGLGCEREHASGIARGDVRKLSEVEHEHGARVLRLDSMQQGVGRLHRHH